MVEIREEDKMSEEEFDNYIWGEIMEEESKFFKENLRINNRILKAIGNHLGEEYLEDLKYCIKDCNISEGVYEFSKKPIGNLQKEDYGKIKYMWVDQHGPVVDADDFYGTISIELKPYKYLILSY